MSLTCDACGAEVLDIDVKCDSCGHHLTHSGAHQMLGQIVLGQYEVVDILGQGGMSIVYKGRHKLTEQEVALKILPPELAAHSQVKSRFLEEAKALAALDHPNIVHLYNFGSEGGSFVLAMQFVRGTTWERMILEADQLHWGLAAGICIDVLKALEFAHSRGIIHRDMKPSNVLVREDDGSATVMDFGIAKMTTSTKLTATGQTMGTVRYMSPEQVRGKAVDPTTDIYSLGATLYEAVVGDTPFDGDTHFEIMTKHLNEVPVPPSAHGVQLPGKMERAIMRALAKRPEDRFATAREFRDVLEAALEAGDLGEAETLRMTRDFVLAMPKESASQTANLSSPTPSDRVAESSDSGAEVLASAAESFASPEPAAAGTDEVIDRGRRPVIWIALAALVAVASAVVAVVLITGGESQGKATPPPAPPAPAAPTLPEPYQLSGVSFTVDQTFGADLVRVMSLDQRDAGEVRAMVVDGVRQFAAFLRERGHAQPLARQPLTVQVVSGDLLCRPELYTSDEMRARCGALDAWYQPKEKTLLVAADGSLDRRIATNVASVICLHQRKSIAICNRQLLDDFAKRLGPPTKDQ